MQEQEDDEHRKDGAEYRRMLQRVDRFEDEATLLEDRLEVHRGIATLKFGHLGVDAVGDGDDVGVGLSADAHPKRRNAVEPREDALFLDRIGDSRDVAQIDRRSVLHRGDGVGQFVGRPIELASADAELVGADGDDAGRIVDVLRRDRLDDRIVRQSVTGQQLLVGFDHDGAGLPAGDERAADARDRRELVGEAFQALGLLVHLGRELVIENRRRNGGNEADRSREQGLGDARLHNR